MYISKGYYHMKKGPIIIGISALAVCICAAAVLIKVVLTPAKNDSDSAESWNTAESTAPLLSTEAEGTGTSQSIAATELEDTVTAAGGLPAAPAPMDLTPESITVLVNRDYKLTEEYIPDDLVVPDVRFTFSYYDDKKLMRKEAADALKKLFDAGDAEGVRLYGVSAYRSYTRQYTIYATNLITKGVNHTNRYSAAPGASEHQTGLVIDVSSDSAGQALEEVFGTTKEGIWLAANAYRFGFIIRYPKDLEDLTGYYYEPWHIRYVGTELASYLYDNNLTLDEYYGYEPSVEFASLANTPLIDTNSDRYQKLYQSLKPTPVPTSPATLPNTTQPAVTGSADDLPDETTSQPNHGPSNGDSDGEPEETSASQVTTDTTAVSEPNVSEEPNSSETTASSEVSDPSEDPVSTEAPSEGETPASSEALFSTEAPVSSEASVSTDEPVSSEAKASAEG